MAEICEDTIITKSMILQVIKSTNGSVEISGTEEASTRKEVRSKRGLLLKKEVSTNL